MILEKKMRKNERNFHRKFIFKKKSKYFQKYSVAFTIFLCFLTIISSTLNSFSIVQAELFQRKMSLHFFRQAHKNFLRNLRPSKSIKNYPKIKSRLTLQNPNEEFPERSISLAFFQFFSPLC